VRIWNAEDGWGVIDSSDTPGGCWVHYSSLLVPGPGYRELVAGQAVELDYEAARQDGYDFRAVELWLAGEEPDRSGTIEITGPSEAYQSGLFIRPDPDR